MIPNKEFIDADGKLIGSFQDSDTGLGFIVGSKGGLVRISVYFNDQRLAPDFTITQGGALILSEILRKAAYHGK